MRQPAGECRYCGREFMSKQSLAKHEAENCPERVPEAAKPAHERWRRRQMLGGQTVWVMHRD